VFTAAEKGIFHVFDALCLFFNDIFGDLVQREDQILFVGVAAFASLAGGRGVLQQIFRHADGGLMVWDHLADK